MTQRFWILFVRIRIEIKWIFPPHTTKHAFPSSVFKMTCFGGTSDSTHSATSSEAVNRSQSRVPKQPPGLCTASSTCSLGYLFEKVETTTFPAPWVIFFAAYPMHYRNTIANTCNAGEMLQTSNTNKWDMHACMHCSLLFRWICHWLKLRCKLPKIQCKRRLYFICIPIIALPNHAETPLAEADGTDIFFYTDLTLYSCRCDTCRRQQQTGIHL